MLLDSIKRSLRSSSTSAHNSIRLEITDGWTVGSASSKHERLISWSELPALIGRDQLATIVLDDRSVSRAHCELAECEGDVVLRDLESKNGVRINGAMVNSQVLRVGDEVFVGRARLRVVSIPVRADSSTCRAGSCKILASS